MTSRLIAFAILMATSIIGLIRLFAERRDLMRRQDSVSEYYARFSQFVGNSDFDAGAYVWLTKRALIVQEQIGAFGLLSYKPAGARYFIPNYQVIVNSLPELRRAMTTRSLSGFSASDLQEAAWCMEALLRYLGVLDVRRAESARKLRNPLVWLRQGVQFILLLPVSVFHWLGLIGSSLFRRIKDSGIVRVISGLIALVALMSEIVTICVGWDEFTRLVMQWWQTLF